MQVTLHNDDCLCVLKNIADQSIDLIVTDPPYRTTARGNAGNSGGMLQKEINKRGRVFVHNNIVCSEYAAEFYRVLKDGSHCYVMSNHINLIEMLNTFTSCGFHFTKSLIWDKGNKIMGQYYMSQFEYVLFFRKGRAKRIANCGTSDIIAIPNRKTKDANGNNIHDTEKPVELMQILIENSSKFNDLILDPFMGSGSTGVACAKTHRNFIGIEIDKTYFDIARERVNKANSSWLDDLLGGG